MHDSAPPEFGIGRVTRFYIPLLLQAFSQSLTYPLVAGIVTHGAYGVHELTAFAQGQMVMFMIGAIGGGLVITGMVFAKTRRGYAEFRRLNTLMMTALLVLQCLPALPPFNRWLFEGFFALPPHLAETARWTLLLGVVMNGSFFLRNVPMVVLFNRLESGKANMATLSRIAVSFVCSVAFPRFGLVGAYWGLSVLTLGCVLEYAITWYFARPYIRELPGKDDGERISIAELFRFTLPLSLGSFLLMVSPLLVAAFVGRSADAKDMLAIHYVTLGVANPVAYAALRMQAVAIEFPQRDANDRRLLWYSVVAGIVLGVIPCIFSSQTIGNWYFGVYQNLDRHLLPTARLAIGIYSFIAVIQALRARMEGIAAFAKHPGAVMCGQVSYTAALCVTLAVTLSMGVPGWLMAVSAIFVAPASAGSAVFIAHRIMTARDKNLSHGK